MERRSSSNGFDSLFRPTAGRERAEGESPDEALEATGFPAAGTSLPEGGRRRLIQPSRSFPAVIRVVGVGVRAPTP